MNLAWGLFGFQTRPVSRQENAPPLELDFGPVYGRVDTKNQRSPARKSAGFKNQTTPSPALSNA